MYLDDKFTRQSGKKNTKTKNNIFKDLIDYDVGKNERNRIKTNDAHNRIN